MRGGENGHMRSTVLDACVTQRARNTVSGGVGAPSALPGGIRTLAPSPGEIWTPQRSRARYGRSRRCRAESGRRPHCRAGFGRSEGAERPDVARKRSRCPNLARERGRRSNFARQGKRCPNLARERGHCPKAFTQTRSQARAWQNIPVRAILFHSPYEAPRYVGARRAAIAHAVMRSDSAEGGPWRTTPYKKIACA